MQEIEGQMLKIILKLEEGEVRDRNTKGRNVEGVKRRVARKECKWLRALFEDRGFMAPKNRCGTLPDGVCWKTGEQCSGGRRFIQRIQRRYEEWDREVEEVDSVDSKRMCINQFRPQLESVWEPVAGWRW